MFPDFVRVGAKSWIVRADILPAPVVRDVPIKYDVVRFNGSLLKENIFRQTAGPEVDAAWESLGVNCMH